MESEDTFYVPKLDGTTCTQTSYTGKLRWKEKLSWKEGGHSSVKLVLQQEEITNFIENHVISKQEIKWVDVPIDYDEV